MNRRPIAGLMLVEAATLAVASVIHFGIVVSLGGLTISDAFAGARIPEAILAAVLAGGAAGLIAGWRGSWWLALSSNMLALIGVLVGVRVVMLGTTSRPGDLVYHAGLFVLLLISTALLVRGRTRQSLVQQVA
jgi:hypothetical protein